MKQSQSSRFIAYTVAFLTIMSTIWLVSCEGTLSDTISRTQRRDIARKLMFTKLYAQNKIKSQLFNIPTDKDTLIRGEKGTLVQIYANTFEGMDASETNGRVNLELKEATERNEMVLGNLTTTSPDGMLESDGMIYLDAKDDQGNNLKIKDDKEIGVILPTDKRDRNMQVYQGVPTDSGMSWVDPSKPLNSKVLTLEREYKVAWYQAYDRKGNGIDPSDNEQFKYEMESPKHQQRQDTWFWEGHARRKGDTLRLDHFYLKFNKYETDKVKLRKSNNGVWVQDVITKKGRNTFISDYNTNYIYGMKNLGWTNIDKLVKTDNSKEVDMVISVANQAEFDYIFTSMVFHKRKTYIPGYQKEDNTFSFGSSDNQKTILPIGEDVTVIATAYKDSIPFISTNKFTIAEQQTINMTLEQTTPEALNAKLEEEL